VIFSVGVNSKTNVWYPCGTTLTSEGTSGIRK